MSQDGQIIDEHSAARIWSHHCMPRSKPRAGIARRIDVHCCTRLTCHRSVLRHILLGFAVTTVSHEVEFQSGLVGSLKYLGKPIRLSPRMQSPVHVRLIGVRIFALFAMCLLVPQNHRPVPALTGAINKQYVFSLIPDAVLRLHHSMYELNNAVFQPRLKRTMKSKVLHRTAPFISTFLENPFGRHIGEDFIAITGNPDTAAR